MSDIVLGSDAIQIAGRTVAGSSLGRLKSVHRITDSTDVALGTCASGGTRVGSSFSASIPTSGIIRVIIEQVRFTYTGAGSAGASAGLAIEVNGTTYFKQYTLAATTGYSPQYTESSGVNTNYYQISSGGTTSSQIYVLDISANSVSTGTQTCYIRCGHTASLSLTDAFSVKGTTTQFVASVEIIDLT